MLVYIIVIVVGYGLACTTRQSPLMCAAFEETDLFVNKS